jgi:hypothetical protein
VEGKEFSTDWGSKKQVGLFPFRVDISYSALVGE